MKKITTLEKERDAIYGHDRSLMKARELNVARKRVAFLNICIAYLKEYPAKEFIEKEINRLENRLLLIDQNYEPAFWKTEMTFLSDKSKFKDYQKDNGVPKLKEQIRALRFIHS